MLIDTNVVAFALACEADTFAARTYFATATLGATDTAVVCVAAESNTDLVTFGLPCGTTECTLSAGA